jgi:hypothetical protein
MKLGNTWITDLSHFLDDQGRIAPDSGPAFRLAQHLTSIVAMVSIAGSAVSQKYRVKCRRRPGRKPCAGKIDGYIDSATNEIVWWCPVCDDNGYISNWMNSMWDLSGADKLH